MNGVEHGLRPPALAHVLQVGGAVIIVGTAAGVQERELVGEDENVGVGHFYSGGDVAAGKRIEDRPPGPGCPSHLPEQVQEFAFVPAFCPLGFRSAGPFTIKIEQPFTGASLIISRRSTSLLSALV